MIKYLKIYINQSRQGGNKRPPDFWKILNTYFFVNNEFLFAFRRENFNFFIIK